jgi:hypothetical protein
MRFENGGNLLIQRLFTAVVVAAVADGRCLGELGDSFGD